MNEKLTEPIATDRSGFEDYLVGFFRENSITNVDQVVNNLGDVETQIRSSLSEDTEVDFSFLYEKGVWEQSKDTLTRNVVIEMTVSVKGEEKHIVVGINMHQLGRGETEMEMRVNEVTFVK